MQAISLELCASKSYSVFYLEYQKDVHGKKSMSPSEQVWIPTRFPRLPFQVSAPISAFCRSGLLLLFLTLCAYGGSDGVVPSLNRDSSYSPLDGLA